MNEGNEQLLSQLQDIHAAADPGWWPPAPGWWLLALLVLLVLALLLRGLLKRLAIARRRRRWVQALETVQREHDPAESPHEYLAAINRLFRAVALKSFPDSACARLQGSDWVAFITALMPETETTCLQALASGPYEPAPEFDPQALDTNFRTWVKRYG